MKTIQKFSDASPKEFLQTLLEKSSGIPAKMFRVISTGIPAGILEEIMGKFLKGFLQKYPGTIPEGSFTKILAIPSRISEGISIETSGEPEEVLMAESQKKAPGEIFEEIHEKEPATIGNNSKLFPEKSLEAFPE